MRTSSAPGVPLLHLTKVGRRSWWFSGLCVVLVLVWTLCGSGSCLDSAVPGFCFSPLLCWLEFRAGPVPWTPRWVWFSSVASLGCGLLQLWDGETAVVSQRFLFSSEDVGQSPAFTFIFMKTGMFCELKIQRVNTPFPRV